MPESSIIIFADGVNQNFYHLLDIPGENSNVFACEEAFSLVKSLKANVVLIDCGFKARVGLKILKEIKRVKPQIPVVLITDQSSEDIVITALKSGVREYFKKPVNLLVLRNTIEELIQLKKKSKNQRLPFCQARNYFPETNEYANKKNISPHLLKILLHIEENLSEGITLKTLANYARMSSCHFSRYFKKNMGKSPMKYVNELRISKSKKLLKIKSLRITEIAFLVGFNDLNRFIRNFKNLTGVTPTAYRKKIKS